MRIHFTLRQGHQQAESPYSYLTFPFRVPSVTMRLQTTSLAGMSLELPAAKLQAGSTN